MLHSKRKAKSSSLVAYVSKKSTSYVWITSPDHNTSRPNERFLLSCIQRNKTIMQQHTHVLELGAAVTVACCAAAWYLHTSRPGLYSKAQRWISRNAPVWTTKARHNTAACSRMRAGRVPAGCAWWMPTCKWPSGRAPATCSLLALQPTHSPSHEAKTS
jgi:hypothetical protein